MHAVLLTVVDLLFIFERNLSASACLDPPPRVSVRSHNHWEKLFSVHVHFVVIVIIWRNPNP